MIFLERTYQLVSGGFLKVEIKTPVQISNIEYSCALVFSGEYKKLGIKKTRKITGIDSLQATLVAIDCICITLSPFKEELKFETDLKTKLGIPYQIFSHTSFDSTCFENCSALIRKRLLEFEDAIK
jgi:hypothetical protein